MVTKTIVIINGTGGSGKDTFVKFVSEYTNVVNFSSVDKVKEVAAVGGYNGGKTEKDRKFLSDLKALFEAYNDMPFRSMAEVVDKFRETDDEILFLHIREPENIARAVNEFGAKSLLVKRVGLENIASNYSDASVDNYDYDFRVENDTLENLREQAILFVENLRGKELKKKYMM